MGSNWSQLKKSIERGDEAKCIDIYNKHSEVKRKLNANTVFNELTMDTYMHICAHQGMPRFLKVLLYENNGNPNMLNRFNQNVLHSCCDGASDNLQYECMQLVLQWHEKAKIKKDQNVENKPNLGVEININEQDIYDNTPLHYASMRNLTSCVQSLVAFGAFLFVENIERCTPCDLAERHGQKDLALYLESKMIFSREDEEKEMLDFNKELIVLEEKRNYGLKIQDLLEEKDKLLLEVSEMMNCGIFTAEILLKKHAWSKESLLEAWIEDPVRCCDKCGISKLDAEKNASNFLDLKNIIVRKQSGRYLLNTQKKGNYGESKSRVKKIRKNHSEPEIRQSSLTSSTDEDLNSSANDSVDLSEETMCQICFCTYAELSKSEDAESDHGDNNEFVKIICGHKFCKQCWEQYLTIKIQEGNVNDILCPQTDCLAIISNETIESLVSKDTAKRYLQFDIRAFVETNPDIKWCPFPGCSMAVRNPRVFERSLIHKKVIVPGLHEQHNVINEFSMTVDCGQGHIFCWQCLQESHEPATCQNWKDWFQKVAELKPETLTDTSEKKEQSANYLWLVTYSKKCPNPNCMSPIQKNEGCNHVRCYKCKFEFCWLCMEPWKKHSGSTGGYFQCNRYEATSKVLQNRTNHIIEAEEAHQKAAESNKFVHYYTRFKNHEHSLNIEKNLLNMSDAKIDKLISAEDKQVKIRSISPPQLDMIEKLHEYSHKLNTNPDARLFIEEAIKELLYARRVLRCSYVYGFFLDQYGHKKFIFEYIQTEFEESTENLSQIIARPHLNTTRNKIIRLTNILRKKRVEFLETIRNGLNSFNDTPPTLKKYSLQRWKYLLKDNIQHDEEFKNTIAVSLKELNPKNPWIIDKKGRHTNLLALLNDLPELEDELDSILVPAKDKNGGLCARWDCTNIRSINSLSGSHCNYCSIKCMRIDRNNYLERKDNTSTKKPPSVTTIASDTASTSSSIQVQPSTSKTATNQLETTMSHQKKSSKSVWKGFKITKKTKGTTNKQPHSINSNVIINSKSLDNLETLLENVEVMKPASQKSSDQSALETIPDSVMSENETESSVSTKCLAVMPFDSLFLKTDKDISYILKNMETVICDVKDQDKKVEKVCNFPVKVKKQN